MDIEKELGMRVKFLRVRKGWTQDQLAKKIRLYESCNGFKN